jgi:formylglycine-generating enzyme required for sulfatase activity
MISCRHKPEFDDDSLRALECREDTIADPQGAKAGKNRVLRGGSWGSHPVFCRSANRNFSGPENRTEFYGLRVCFLPELMCAFRGIVFRSWRTSK